MRPDHTEQASEHAFETVAQTEESIVHMNRAIQAMKATLARSRALSLRIDLALAIALVVKP